MEHYALKTDIIRYHLLQHYGIETIYDGRRLGAEFRVPLQPNGPDTVKITTKLEKTKKKKKLSENVSWSLKNMFK